MSSFPEPNRKVDGGARLIEAREIDPYRMTLLPNDLLKPIVDEFTEEEKDAAYALCLPPR